MSPRRRQSATAGPLPASPRHQVGSVPRSAVHGCLRGSYEARSPPGAFSCESPRPVYSRLGFVYFYSQSIHTTLSSVARRRLSTRAGLQRFSSPDIAIDLQTPPPTRACLHCLSLISAWSDVRHRWRLSAYWLLCGRGPRSHSLQQSSARRTDSHFHAPQSRV